MARKEVFRKEDWVFFMDKGKLKFNEKCQGCVHSCKQSFRAAILKCPKYISERSENQNDKRAKRTADRRRA